MSRETYKTYAHSRITTRYSHRLEVDIVTRSHENDYKSTDMDSTVTSKRTYSDSNDTVGATVLTTYSDTDPYHSRNSFEGRSTQEGSSTHKTHIWPPYVPIHEMVTGYSKSGKSITADDDDPWNQDTTTYKETGNGHTVSWENSRHTTSYTYTSKADGVVDTDYTVDTSDTFTTASARTSTGSVLDTTTDGGIGITGTYSYEDYRNLVSTYSTTKSAITSGTGGSVSTTESTWSWDKYSYQEEDRTVTAINDTSQSDRQTIVNDTSTIVSVTASSYRIYDLHNVTVYVSSNEYLWSVSANAPNTYTSFNYWTDIFGRVSATSLSYKEPLPAVTVSFEYNKVNVSYQSNEVTVNEVTGTGANTGTVDSEYLNRTEQYGGAVWRKTVNGESSQVMEKLTTYVPYFSYDTLFSLTGTGTNTNGITYVELERNKVLSYTGITYLSTYDTISSVNVGSNKHSQTYYPWWGSMEVTSLAYIQDVTTVTELTNSKAVNGDTTVNLGYISITNETITSIPKVITLTSWDEDWAALRHIRTYTSSISSTKSASGSTSFTKNANFLYSSSYSKVTTQTSGSSNTWGTTGITEYTVGTPRIDNTGLMAQGHSPNITHLTPHNPRAVVGFGATSGLHLTGYYAFIDLSSAGGTFTSWQELESNDLAYTSLNMDGMVVMTDDCGSGNMGWQGTYEWSIPENTTAFSTASTVLATYSSTTQTTNEEGTISIKTYTYATYTLNCSSLATGDFFEQYSVSGGNSYGTNHATNVRAFSLGVNGPFTRARSVYLPAGRWSMTTLQNVTGVAVTGMTSHTSLSSAHLITLDDDEAIYLEYEAFVTYRTRLNEGILWTTVRF